jgi:16S rRNA (adenine1518-N6/adenine1519-N6)-dimethyltransferase
VRIDPRGDPLITREDEASFRRFVVDVFGFRRKQMRRVLRQLFGTTVEQADAVLVATGTDPSARPETLSPAQFARLHVASQRLFGDRPTPGR